jgi:hypothetical protein
MIGVVAAQFVGRKLCKSSIVSDYGRERGLMTCQEVYVRIMVVFEL